MSPTPAFSRRIFGGMSVLDGALCLLIVCLASIPMVSRGNTAHASLPAPTMDAPADREASIIFHPHFSWKPVPGATRYLIELGMDRDFRKVVDRDSLDAVIHWYVTDKRLAPGEYFWRVRAEQGCEGDGPWSNVRAFQVLTPRKTFTIHPGMEARKIQQIGREAAAAQSARRCALPAS